MSSETLPKVSRRPSRLAGPAQQRLQARHQLLHGERLGEIVVGALAQAGDAVADAVARRQHQHRRGVVAAAHVAQQDEAVLVGQAEVEDDRCIFHRRENVKSVADRAHRVGREAALGQALLEEGHKLWVVFDQKHPHWLFDLHVAAVWSTIPRPAAPPRQVDVIGKG